MITEPYTSVCNGRAFRYWLEDFAPFRELRTIRDATFLTLRLTVACGAALAVTSILRDMGRSVTSEPSSSEILTTKRVRNA